MTFLKLTYFILLTMILNSCVVNESLNPIKAVTNPYGHYHYNPYFFATSIIGDTIVNNIPFEQTKPSKYPNLSKFKNIDLFDFKDKPFRMVAVGGGISSGIRDGGISNFTMQTSYPKLIANQMGIDFVNPLFESNDFNGIGRLLPTKSNPTGGPVPKQKIISNNLGFTKDNKLKLFEGSMDNYYYTWNDYSISYNLNYSRLTAKDISNDFRYRITNKLEKFDFILVDLGAENAYFQYNNYYFSQKIPNYIPDGIVQNNPIPNVNFINGFPITQYLYDLELQKMAKGVLIKSPLPKYLPYFKDVYKKAYLSTLKDNNLSGIHVKSPVGDFYSIDNSLNSKVILPCSFIDSLLSPTLPLNERSGLSQKRAVKLYATKILNYDKDKTEKLISEKNATINVWAGINKYKNWAVVDLNAIYAKIDAGNFITDDGVKVNPSWPNGNFFSSDGIFPTAFGQSVIANEVIKAINNNFNMEIELIKTKYFLDF